MKKVVFISGIQIFPPESGGQLRSANICRSLSQMGIQVNIYSFTGRKADYLKLKKSSKKPIQNNLDEYTNRNLILGAIQFIFYRFGLPPIWLTFLTSIFIPTNLKKLIFNSNTIILDFPFLYPISNYANKKTFLNTHNAEFELYEKKPIISKLVKKIEIKSFLKCDHVFFCNEDDSKKFNDLKIDYKFSILPNGIDLSIYSNFSNECKNKLRSELNISPQHNIFIFTGSSYYPNLEAFNFLKTWSEKNEKLLNDLNIVVLVVGTVSIEKIDKKNFKVLGKVLNIIPYFYASDFGINPISIGSGTNVKMFEFIASKLPILSSNFGTRGLNLVDNYSCLLFERENFGEILLKAVNLKLEERKLMAQKAFNDNLHLIDMKKALENLDIQW